MQKAHPLSLIWCFALSISCSYASLTERIVINQSSSFYAHELTQIVARALHEKNTIAYEHIVIKDSPVQNKSNKQIDVFIGEKKIASFTLPRKAQHHWPHETSSRVLDYVRAHDARERKKYAANLELQFSH